MSWFFFSVFLLLVVQVCTGKKSCVVWSSGGEVVQRGHSFQVFCTFKDECRRSMKDHSSTPQRPIKFNTTTYYFNVINITNSTTYSCECENFPDLDSCGIDIATGYPPDRPTNISCIYKIVKNDDGVVECTWNSGRQTYLRNTSTLWVKTDSGKVFRKSPAASLTIPRSVQLISVWVDTQNRLGRVNSSKVNYTLSEIVMPSTPSVSQSQCSSTMCIIQLELPVTAANLEIQYRAEPDTWTTFTDTVVQSSSLVTRSISPLQPNMHYDFRVRYKFITGLWSQWSNVSNWTQEDVPAKELDVWFTPTDSDIKSLRIYWKEANNSISRGKIIQYEIMVTPDPTITRISAEQTNYSVPVCAECEVTVWACNSKGRSPPAKITNRPSKGKPPQDVQVSNTNVSISWKRPHSALPLTAYVLEWYPKGLKLAQLQWLRLGIDDTHSVLSGIKTSDCYDGAVFAIYSDGTVSGQRFTDVATSELVPSAAPQVQGNVIGNTLNISWTEIPRSQRGGCITKYTIYVEDESGRQEFYPVASTQRLYTMADMSPGFHSLWMSASTAKGEGPSSQKVKHFIKQEAPLSILLVCVVISIIIVLLLCLCQIRAVKHRFSKVFHCFMPDVVPDPANSKWAKGYNQDKGKMNFQLQLSNCVSMEEDPVLVDVEELHEHNGITYAQTISTQLSAMSPELCPLYPLTTYIKSFSQDSRSSKHTQVSMETTTTVDYITAHGSASSDEEYEVEDEDCADLHFLPSLSVSADPLESGGRLTLDAVRIDCTNFFEHI